MKSVMNHFSQAPQAEIPRSSFDRSHGHKTTFNAGGLIPFFVDEALPGDTFNLRTSGFARMATPIFPVMDNMHMETFYFAVPIRLVWDNFQKMMGEQTNPGDSTDYLAPIAKATAVTGYLNGSLMDYFGVPTGIPDLEHSALYHRAYMTIWNEWFRDQNLQDTAFVSKLDTPDELLGARLNPLPRGKRHDYFTSCLPWPQKGPEIQLPLGTQAPLGGRGSLSGFGVVDSDVQLVPNVSVRQPAGQSSPNNYQSALSQSASATWRMTTSDTSTARPDVYADMSKAGSTGDVAPYADLTNATAATINQLRMAFQVQKMYERDARGGTRYTEIVRSHFGVTSPDARLQRPEYLGGGSTPINISTIQSTAQTNTDGSSGRDLGSLSAMGTASFQGHGFTKSFTEHTIIIGLVNVRADLTYQQGLNRMWSRRDRLDFFWPALSHLGEQEVLNQEIYAQDPAAEGDPNKQIFGYQERYAEYRYKPSLVTGKFRSTDAASLDAWHLSQEFKSLPTLSKDFIEDNPPIDRVVAVTAQPHFIGDFFHKLTCVRPMPLYGTPGNIDRF